MIRDRLRGAWADLLELTRKRSIPDPPAGRPVIYLDAQTQRPVLALGSKRFEIPTVDRSAAAVGDLLTSNGGTMVRLPRGSNGEVLISTASGLRWSTNEPALVGSVSGDITVNNGAASIQVKWGTLTVAGAVTGQLVVVGYDGLPSSEVKGGALAYVSAANTVRIGIPVTQTAGDLDVSVIATVYDP